MEGHSSSNSSISEDEANDLFHQYPPSPIELNEDDDSVSFVRPRNFRLSSSTPKRASEKTRHLSSQPWKSPQSTHMKQNYKSEDNNNPTSKEQRRHSNASTTTILEEWRALRTTRKEQSTSNTNNTSYISTRYATPGIKSTTTNATAVKHLNNIDSSSYNTNQVLFVQAEEEKATIQNISSVTMETDLPTDLLVQKHPKKEEEEKEYSRILQQLEFYKNKCQHYEREDKPQLLQKIQNERQKRKSVHAEKTKFVHQVQIMVRDIQSELLLVPNDDNDNSLQTNGEEFSDNSRMALGHSSIISVLHELKSHVTRALSERSRLEADITLSQEKLYMTSQQAEQKAREMEAMENEIQSARANKTLLTKEVEITTQQLYSLKEQLQKEAAEAKAQSELVLKEANQKARQIQIEASKKVADLEAIRIADFNKRSAQMLDAAFQKTKIEINTKEQELQKQNVELETLRTELLDVQRSQVEAEQGLKRFEKELEERFETITQKERQLQERLSVLDQRKLDLEDQESKMEQVSISLDSRLAELDDREEKLRKDERRMEKDQALFSKRVLDSQEATKQRTRELESKEASIAAKRKEIDETTRNLDEEAEQLRICKRQLDKERESLEGEKASCAEQWALIEKEKQNVELFRKRSRDSSEGEAQRILECISELEDHEEALREREEEIVGKEKEIAATLSRLELQSSELRQREDAVEHAMDALKGKENDMAGKLEELSAKLEAGKHALRNIDDKRAASEHQYAQLNSNLHTIQATIKDIIAQSQERVSQLEEQIRSKQVQLSELNVKVSAASERRAEVENLLKLEEEKSKEILTEWEEKLCRVRNELRQYQSDLKISTDKLSESQEAYHCLEQQIEREKNKWEAGVVTVKREFEQSIRAQRESFMVEIDKIRQQTRGELQELVLQAMGNIQHCTRELEVKTSKVNAQHEKLKLVVIQMTEERKSFDQRKALFAQEQSNFNSAQEYQRIRMQKEKDRILQLEKQVLELEDQLMNERESFRAEKEQAFLKLESNVTTVRQKLVTEVDSLREELVKIRSEYAESEVAHNLEKDRFHADFEVLKSKFDDEQETLRGSVQTLEEELNYEKQQHQKLLSTISALRERITEMQHALNQRESLISTEKRTLESQRQFMNDKRKRMAAAACKYLIAHKDKESMRKAFNLWHHVLLEYKIRQKREHAEHQLQKKSIAIEKMKTDIQITHERKVVKLKEWEDSLNKREKEHSDRESLLLESRRALGEEWNSLGGAMEEAEKKSQSLQARAMELAKREAEVALKAKENEVSRAGIRELTRKLDEERRVFNYQVAQNDEMKVASEREKRISVTKKEADLQAREEILMEKECEVSQALRSLQTAIDEQRAKRLEIDEKEASLKAKELEEICKRKDEARALSERKDAFEAALRNFDAEQTTLISEKALIEKQLRELQADRSTLDQEKSQLLKQGNELDSRARSLDDRENALIEKEEEHRRGQNTWQVIQTQKSYVEDSRKSLLYSEEELGRQRQMLMVELDARESMLREKEEKLNDASIAVQALKEEQRKKAEEIEKWSERLASRELDFSKRSERDAKALSESTNMLERSRQVFDLNCAELEAEKSRVEKQSDELRCQRENLYQEKSELSRQADILTLKGRTLDCIEIRLKENEKQQIESQNALHEMQIQKSQLEIAQKLLMDCEKELEEKRCCLEIESNDLRGERSKVEQEKSKLARQADELALRARSLDSKETLLREKEEIQAEVTRKLLLESENVQRLAVELDSREKALNEKEVRFGEDSMSLKATMEEQLTKRRAIAEKEKYLESKERSFSAKLEENSRAASDRAVAVEKTRQQLELQLVEVEEEKNRIAKQLSELLYEKAIVDEEKSRLSRQATDLATRERKLEEMEIMVRKEQEMGSSALREIESQKAQLEETRLKLRASQEELRLQQQSLAINSKDAKAAQDRIKQLALQLKEKDEELRRDRDALDQRLRKCDECEGFLSAWQEQLDRTSAALQAREREIISKEDLL